MPQLALNRLSTHCAAPLAPCYVLHGAEPLLLLEAHAQLRKAATAQGFTESTVLHLAASDDWRQLFSAGAARGLFGDKSWLDIRIPSGKPGKAGGEALQAFAKSLPEDTVSVFSFGELERDQFKSAWFTALSNAALVIESPRIDKAAMPNWLKQRGKEYGVSISDEALFFLVDKTEGNLVAANQELKKLSLLAQGETLSLAAVQSAVLNMARFTLVQLSEALLQGDAARAMRVLDGLQGEGQELPLLLWSIAEDARAALKLQTGGQVWLPEPRKSLAPQAARRLTAKKIGEILELLALADKQFKGVASGEVWGSLVQTVALFCPAKPQLSRS